MSSLQKCEKFYKKLEEKNDSNESKKKKATSDSYSINDSELDNDNFRYINENKIREEKVLKQREDKNEDKKNTIKNYIFQIL